ncbi:MAG: DUF485 domain-containing protein [Planctomycetaceae bacterium]|nr:DUF485 domain-containing protein [Planctomycetaceae bacterium]
MTDQPSSSDDPVLLARQSRLALRLFAVYLIAYAGFMGLAAFAPQVMAQPALFGVNVAILYGLALIFGALLLALLYMRWCHRIEVDFHAERGRT